MGNIGAFGESSNYSAMNAAMCGARNIPACIQAIMGILQMMQSLKGASDSGATGADLLNGDYGKFTFDPAKNGFCFDPSTGCTQDGIDKELSVLDTAFKTGKGYDEAISKLKANAAKKLKGFENKGYKVDSANGTITAPNGQVTSFADAAAKVPKNFGTDASKKFAGVLEKLKKHNNGRGLASAGGGTIFKDEYYGGKSGYGSNKKEDGKKAKGKKKSLLASLTDKNIKKNAIGIAGDNIFGMVNRRYIKKTKSLEFMKK